MTLGPCCICESPKRVRNIIQLYKKSPKPGRGWGCLVCGLPSDGAVAVLCDPCFEQYRVGQAILKYACRGYPAKDGRVPISFLAGEHKHDLKLHPEVL